MRRLSEIKRLQTLLIRRIGTHKQEIVPDRPRKKLCFLGNESDTTSKIIYINLAAITIIKKNRATARRIQHCKKFYHGALARTRRTDKCHSFSRAYDDIHIRHSFSFSSLILKRDIAILDALDGSEPLCGGLFRNRLQIQDIGK